MLDRVASVLPIDASGIWGGTFHSVGNRILRRHGSAIGYNSGFSIMDREDQKELINTVVASAGIDPKEIRFHKGDVLWYIFRFVMNTETPMEELLAEKFPYFIPLLDKIKDVQSRYETKKKATNSIDFDDLLQKTLTMLQQHEGIAQFYCRQFQFILVDEYQDTNKIQADLIDLLAQEHRNVMVVGDDAQSIYSWRGANFQNILEFPKRYPDAKVFKIEMNYRSVPEILGVANAGDEVAFKRMAKLLPGIGNRSADNLWNGWDRSLNQQGEITSWSERLLPMNVSTKSKKHWTQLANTLDEIAPGGQPNPPSEMITSVMDAIYDDYAKVNFTNYELRKEDLNQLAAFGRQFKDLNEFLSQLALISNVDAEVAPNQTADREAVNLSTVHQAKGLEFHTVFVIWLTDGMFPSSRSMEQRKDLEEERRLFYVAITRAKDELYLSYPHMRLTGGYGDVFQRPSRFLKEIPNKLVEDWDVKRS